MKLKTIMNQATSPYSSMQLSLLDQEIHLQPREVDKIEIEGKNCNTQ